MEMEMMMKVKYFFCDSQHPTFSQESRMSPPTHHNTAGLSQKVQFQGKKNQTTQTVVARSGRGMLLKRDMTLKALQCRKLIKGAMCNLIIDSLHRNTIHSPQILLHN